MSKNKTLFVLLFIFFVLVCGLVLSLNLELPKQETPEPMEKTSMPMPIPEEPANPLENNEIAYNFPDSLSGKSKEEVFELRKEYVAKSIFASDDYSPSEEVFGEIESGKPWIALNICRNPETSVSWTDGPSEEARFINNPTILVALEHPFAFIEGDNYEWCTSKLNNMIPKRILYDKDNNEISVFYKQLPFTTNNGDYYSFNGINARDFGYKYAYVDLSKSTYNPEFTNEENVSNQIAEFQNYIHLGGSCGVEGGCNNGSPDQPMLNFYNHRTEMSGKNGMIYIKLWKNPPASPDDEPDIVEKIILKNY